MEKFIEVHDNILSKETEDFLESVFLGKYNIEIPYYFTDTINSSDPNSTEYIPGFYNLVYEKNKKINFDLFHLCLQPLYELSTIRKFMISSIELSRFFLQTPSKQLYSQSKHVDLEYPHWVCLYYVNGGDGNTIFLDDQDNIIKEVEPKKGRFAFFDGSISHKGGVPLDKHRIVINTDFIGNFY